jgi:iron complex transport system permease protein
VNTVHTLAPVVIAVSIYGWAISQRMDLLVLGDREVFHLGHNPRAIRFSAFIVISILVATAVSAVGTIAFLALAAPHITRYLIGPTARPLIIGSGVIGAGILLVADTLARTVAAPNELPIGLITSLIGAPILIFMLHRNSEVWK